MQQIFSILPIAALVIVAFMVVKAIAKAAPRSITVEAALPMGGGALPMSFTQGSRSGESHTSSGALPASSHSASKVADMLGSVNIEEEEDETDPVRVGQIRAKVDVPLEQIRKMAQQRPDAIATLLKSWMLEDRR
jgi:flagellar biosynthesis/type III secretory pathway M-ring protein FliF/YscJ